MTNSYSEDRLVEQPAIALFETLDWATVNCFCETFGPSGTLGRETTSEVVLSARLRPALERLNPGLPAEALNLAIDELTCDRSVMSPAAANREIYRILRDGVKVSYREASGEERVETVRVIDWNEPENNDFLLASQFWVTGEMYKRRADLIGFVNGLPLLFMELKASHRKLEHAFHHNLSDYKDTIPHLFWYNAFIILSNGSQSRVGSMTAAWEHFSEWKKITSEGEAGIVSLETMIRGTCDKRRFLDMVENFIIYEESYGGLRKLVARNHQSMRVNNAIAAVQQMQENQGRLGVFWHTQGSGKSYSMVFFSQKVLRKLSGNWTFLLVTDRQELDDQIYKNFANCGAVTEPEESVHAGSGEHLKELLREDHRLVFTLIQKFRTDRGETYPMLSDRADIIVMTDEAHRSQYDIFAMNMRNALPNAAFIGFTGTPLMAGEELTRQVFGDYVSVYNFKQSADDNATVPLYYENRIPELQLTNENLNEEMEELLEAAELDEAQERKLEREFAREYHLITRDERLEKVADDIVSHFMGRGQMGKAMVIAIDKATAVRMYDKVQLYWRREISHLMDEYAIARTGSPEAAELLEKLDYMQQTDMAVVVSQGQNEVEEFREKGFDIATHRRRMLKEDLDKKFKDPDDRLRIVFVCAMWITGFDVPCCSTIYLDKPMKNHTLMQTIARANRVFRDKVNGLIVDYIGVFRSLQKALAIYGAGAGGGTSPVEDKAFLVAKLREQIAETEAFCERLGVPLNAIQAADGFGVVKLLDDAVEAILVNEESKRRYLSMARLVNRLYKAILPDPRAGEFSKRRTMFVVIAEKILSLEPEADISEVMGQVEALLDHSIATEGYVIAVPGTEWERIVDLSQIDFEALRKHFATGRQRTEIEKLKNLIEQKLQRLVSLNRTRIDYLEKFQQLIEEYNSGAHNAEVHFERLVEFARGLNEEERRHIAEELSEEELTIFDLLIKPDVTLSEKEKNEVKKVARELLATLKREQFSLDWRKRQQGRARVRLTIEEVLDHLPPVYSKELYDRKCDSVYQHVYDSYYGGGRSVYSAPMVH
jgi:type I restriction enzyme R subunit